MQSYQKPFDYWLIASILPCKRIGFTPDNRRVFPASTDGTARLWDVDNDDTVRPVQRMLGSQGGTQAGLRR
jgi:WD40 repeat protein